MDKAPVIRHAIRGMLGRCYCSAEQDAPRLPLVWGQAHNGGATTAAAIARHNMPLTRMRTVRAQLAVLRDIVGACVRSGVHRRPWRLKRPSRRVSRRFSQPPVARATMTTHHQNCRMYENKFPEVDDVVMVEVRHALAVPMQAALLAAAGHSSGVRPGQ